MSKLSYYITLLHNNPCLKFDNMILNVTKKANDLLSYIYLIISQCIKEKKNQT